MRNLIIIGLLAAVAAPVSAQSVGEVRRGEREVQQQRRELQDARRFGDSRDVREERRDVQGARQALREDRRDLRDARRDRRPYVAPYRGWHYRAVSPGYRLQPGFYGQRYFVTNPSWYRLRPAARNRQWVRYGNDLLLVNVRNGRVIQVVRGRY